MLSNIDSPFSSLQLFYLLLKSYDYRVNFNALRALRLKGKKYKFIVVVICFHVIFMFYYQRDENNKNIMNSRLQPLAFTR